MKRIKMNVVKTDGFREGTIDTNYVGIDTDYHAGWGLPIHHTKIISEKIEMVAVFCEGDRVICELKRGSFQNEDGISSGDKWVRKTGMVDWVNIADDGLSGIVKFDDGDIQSISMIRGSDGYPGRNIQPAGNEIMFDSENLKNYVYERPEEPTPYNVCHEPYRRGIGQGFGDTEDG